MREVISHQVGLLNEALKIEARGDRGIGGCTCDMSSTGAT